MQNIYYWHDYAGQFKTGHGHIWQSLLITDITYIQAIPHSYLKKDEK